MHYEWTSKTLEQTDRFLISLGEKGRKLHHHSKKQVFTIGHPSIEFFSFTDWFTVSMDIQQSGNIHYYCNIALPAVLDGDVLSFIDLDLDLVYRNNEWKVLDEDEFERNSKKYQYPDDLAKKAFLELDNLKDAIARRQFPFDGTLTVYLNRMAEGHRTGSA